MQVGTLKELEFDFAMRKISQADFDEMAGRLRQRALGLMEQLDAGGGYRDQIEQEVAKRLGAPAAPDAPDACACGTSNDPDARFCKSCGHRFSTATD